MIIIIKIRLNYRGGFMRLLSLIPARQDATSFYRAWGPLSHLHKLDPNFRHTMLGKEFVQIDALGHDIAFLQRPDSPNHIKIVKQLKDINIPVVLDYDDDLLDVPEHNKYHKQMELIDNDYKSVIKELLSLADHVIVSTATIKNNYEKYNKNITVISNAIDTYSLKIANTFNRDSKTILWRGGNSHYKDLDLFKTNILKLCENLPDYKFIFAIPSIPNWIKASGLKNVFHQGYVDVLTYFKSIKEMKPLLTLVPLEDSNFNHCKSDIVALEAIYAGSNAIVPDWDEWNWNGATYKNNFEFYKNAYSLIKDLDFAQDVFSKANETVKNYRTIEMANAQRLQVFRSCLR